MQKCIFINYSDILSTQKWHFANAKVPLYQCVGCVSVTDRERERCGLRTRTMRIADANGADRGRERCGPRTRTVRKLLSEPHFCGFLHQQFHKRLAFVSHTVVEHGVLQILFQERSHREYHADLDEVPIGPREWRLLY